MCIRDSHFTYGVYELLSGSREFEEEYQFLTDIMVREYEANSICETPYWGIQCELDQYFPQCNSVGMLGMKVYDLIHGTDLNERYSKKIYEFIYDRVSDKETGLLFAKYHPSHDQGEPYITGFCNAWGLNLLHPYYPQLLEGAYRTFIRYFGKELMDGQALYIKEYANFDEASTGREESMGVFYSMALAKEYQEDVYKRQNQLHLSRKDGVMESIATDATVLSIGVRSRNELEKEVSGCCDRLYVIGDAKKPGRIGRCV